MMHWTKVRVFHANWSTWRKFHGRQPLRNGVNTRSKTRGSGTDGTGGCGGSFSSSSSSSSSGGGRQGLGADGAAAGTFAAFRELCELLAAEPSSLAKSELVRGAVQRWAAKEQREQALATSAASGARGDDGSGEGLLLLLRMLLPAHDQRLFRLQDKA
jgi:hypothetical protein